LLGLALAFVAELALVSPVSRADADHRSSMRSAFAPKGAAQRQPGAAYARLPLAFVPNAGQSRPAILFQMQDRGFSIAFKRREALLVFGDRARGHALAFRFLGADPDASVVGRRQLSGEVDYLLGSDPAKWRTRLPSYGELVYRELWQGIDLAFHGQGGKLKYEFRLRPGADPGRIRLAYVGAERVSLTATGSLAVSTSLGTLTDSRPRSYQPGRKQEAVSSAFVLRGSHEFGFHLGPYDRGRPLVIDPGLAYSTFLGGSAGESGSAIAVDAAGNAYVTGGTNSVDFPTTPGAFDRSRNSVVDAFVTKLSADGSGLVYSTFRGGSGDDNGWGIAVDQAGSVHVTGNTSSGNFPTTRRAYDRGYNGGDDAFLTKLSHDGSKLIYSTFLGGAATDEGDAITVDGQGNAYVHGWGGTGFPTTPDAFDRTCQSVDVMVAKLNRAGSKLVYSTCLGGWQGELAGGIAVDQQGSAYVSGETDSSDFPTTAGAFDRQYSGKGDCYVTKLNKTGRKLLYSTFLGGSDGQGCEALAVDQAGSAHVSGATLSSDFPTTPGAFDTSFNGFFDAFVTKLNPAGSGLVYSTFLGGAGYDRGEGIALDSLGDAYLTGITGSKAFPITPDAFDPSYNDSADAFVTRLSADGRGLVYSTYLGGTGWDEGRGIAVDQGGDAYLTGPTGSFDFPTTPDAYDRICGCSDAFVTELPTQ
jgi:hypothetical protein